MKIETALLADAPSLADIFLGHISAHTEYISHGEIQMGVGEGAVRDGVLVARPAPDARAKWMKYIHEHLTDSSFAQVWKALDDSGAIIGFCVADIEDDGDAPFGMVCDVLVKESARGCGAGEALLKTAISWLRSRGVKDIYLESGKNNHAAHRFFEKRGFVHVSEIYKLA
ncbi:MAG: GNAT family N-acetyltransferase [Bacteroidales bacterium]|nr:GNAT family N-acetyltransferase [Bacteroidales bacterium]MBR6306455.1 GNAT family N-acetyltransferase [Bacteroidales bacterium]